MSLSKRKRSSRADEVGHVAEDEDIQLSIHGSSGAGSSGAGTCSSSASVNRSVLSLLHPSRQLSPPPEILLHQ